MQSHFRDKKTEPAVFIMGSSIREKITDVDVRIHSAWFFYLKFASTAVTLTVVIVIVNSSVPIFLFN